MLRLDVAGVLNGRRQRLILHLPSLNGRFDPEGEFPKSFWYGYEALFETTDAYFDDDTNTLHQTWTPDADQTRIEILPNRPFREGQPLHVVSVHGTFIAKIAKLREVATATPDAL